MITNWLVLFVAAVLPLYIIRFQFFGIPTTFLEILILFTFLVWFVEARQRVKKWKQLFDFENFYLPISFFLIMAVVSTLLSFDKIGGLGILKAFFIEPALLFLVFFERIKNGADKFVLIGLIFGAIWLSVLAFFQLATGLGVPGDAHNEIAQGRVMGVYNSANSLALYLGPIFALSLGWLLTQIPKINSGYLIFYVGLGLFLQGLAIILTKSQAGILALFVILFFLVISRFLSWKKAILTFKLISFLAVFLAILFPVLANFGISLGEILSDQTLQNRFFLWQGTVNLLLDRPLIGAGLDGFKELYVNYRLPAYDELLQYPHNLILNFWTELGLFGVLAFFWILFIFFKNSANNKTFGLGLLGAILYILIHGIVDVPYFKNDLSSQFFILLALSKVRSL